MPTLGDTLTVPVGIRDLELDPENPRLAIEYRDQKLPQRKLLEIMLEEFELEELAESFIENGFFENEPLLAIPIGTKLRVVEGNRRVAALKLLVDGPTAQGLKSESFSKLHTSFKHLATEKKTQLGNPTVCIIKDASKAIGYIGFRHVTGIKPWPALEKAGYIVHLVEKYELSAHQIAPLIGSKPAYVARHYQAYRAICQARDEGIVDVSKVESQFGVFMRALQTDGVLQFFGGSRPTAAKLDRTPVKKRPRFKEFVVWAFGTEDTPPILPESRMLTRFGAILRSERAVSYLRVSKKPDFEQAFLISGGDAEEALTAIRSAEFALRDAVPLALGMKSDRQFADSLNKAAGYLAQILTHFPDMRSLHFAR